MPSSRRPAAVIPIEINPGEEPMPTRRSILASAASALAFPLASAWPRLAGATEHWVAGGSGGIQRGQFSFTATSSNGGYGTIRLPAPGVSYMLPLTVQVFDEAAGARYRLLGDGLVTVLADGLYDLTANLDWPAQPRGSGQDGYDVNLREVFVQRVPVGVAPPVYTPGKVTPIADGSPAYDNLAAVFMPGSSVPNAVRTSVQWAPGTIAAGAMVATDVALPAGSFAPGIGDLVRASHTSLADAVLGTAANTGLAISARIVAPGRVRVVVENRYNAGAVTIPEGTLNLLAQSATSTAGNSVDAWSWIGSGPVELLANEKLMMVVCSRSPDDFLQIDASSFLRISNIVPS
jgi:hypothetical protein